ncbi:MAG TPA: hypothetical protein VLX90_08215, partial [Steroidobacteraceae bacterium]|nr:hypothetical protein [Steroidobacteraceae bacterium]
MSASSARGADYGYGATAGAQAGRAGYWRPGGTRLGTLQYVSGNRIARGVGTACARRQTVARGGVPYENRGRRTDEALR